MIIYCWEGKWSMTMMKKKARKEKGKQVRLSPVVAMQDYGCAVLWRSNHRPWCLVLSVFGGWVLIHCMYLSISFQHTPAHEDYVILSLISRRGCSLISFQFKGVSTSWLRCRCISGCISVRCVARDARREALCVLAPMMSLAISNRGLCLLADRVCVWGPYGVDQAGSSSSGSLSLIVAGSMYSQISKLIAADLMTSIHSSQSSASFSITLTFVVAIDSVACVKEREVMCGRMKIEEKSRKMDNWQVRGKIPK